MKNIINAVICITCMAIGLTSCSNDIDEVDSYSSQTQENMASRAISEEESDTFTVHAIYKGVDYYSVAVTSENKISYLSEDFNGLMDKIASIPTSVSFIHNDQVVEYFDSQEEFLEKYGIRELTEEEKTRCMNAERLNYVERPSTVQTRNIVENYQKAKAQMNDEDLAYCGVYDDTNYSDTHIFMHITDSFQVHDYQYLKDYKLNDKISSLLVMYNMTDPELCAILTVWEGYYFNQSDTDGTKLHRANFVATKNSPINSVWNLKKVSCFNSSDSWNDRISSLSFHLGYADSLPTEY